MFSKFAESAQQSKVLADLYSLRASKLAELAEIEKQLEDAQQGKVVAQQGKADSAVAVPERAQPQPSPQPPDVKKDTKPAEPRRRVPTKLQVATKIDSQTGKRKRGRPSRAEAPGMENQQSLEEVIVTLVQRHKDGLSLAELVEKALQSGYTTTSQNFTNMVQQAIGRLMKKNVLAKDSDTMKYITTEAA